MGWECLGAAEIRKRCVQGLNQLKKYREGLRLEQGSQAVAATQFWVVVFVGPGRFLTQQLV